MRKTTTFRAISCSAAAAIVLVACGKKGDPLPPLRLVPASAEAVTVRQIGDRLRLTWRAPSRNEDGSTESVNLEKARVLRRVREIPPPAPAPPPETAEPTEPAETTETSPAEPTPAPTETPPSPPVETPPAEPRATATGEAAQTTETPSPAGEAQTPTAAPPPPPFRSEAVVVQEVESSGLGELQSFEEPVDPAWIGKRVEYALVYENRKGRESAISEVARVDTMSVVAPPGAPTLEAAEGFVAVKWSAPEGAPPDVAFSVYRRLEDAKVYPDAPLNPEPLAAPSYEDRSAVFGAPLCYVVSAVLGPSGNVSSLPSEEACITPQDRFPPKPPSGLVAVPSEGSVLLSWREVEASDVKAYRVYRGEAAEGPFLFLGEVQQTTYTDTNAESDETYFYFVTAIDNAPEGNESAKSEAVEVRLNR